MLSNLNIETGLKTKRYWLENTYLNYDDYLISCPSLVKDSFYGGDYVSACKECPFECRREIFNPSISRLDLIYFLDDRL